MIDEAFEWQYRFRMSLYRRIGLGLLDPRLQYIKTEAGRQAKTSFDVLYRGDRRWSWPCFVEFLQNCAHVREPDHLLPLWAEWFKDYFGARGVSVAMKDGVRRQLHSKEGPNEGIESPDMGAWFDFAGYLLFRESRLETSGPAGARQVGAILLSALKKNPRKAGD